MHTPYSSCDETHANFNPPPTPHHPQSQAPDPSGSGQCLTPGGITEAAPIICPQYAGDGCCTWQQNYVLWRNLHTLVKTYVLCSICRGRRVIIGIDPISSTQSH